MTPSDRKYAKTHEWVKLEGAMAVVGITEYAQHSLGDVTFLETKPAGTKLAAGAECGVVESVKAASDIYAPIGGEVAEVNAGVLASPELLNQEPFGKGWILKLKNVTAADMDSLLSAEQYDQLTAAS